MGGGASHEELTGESPGWKAHISISITVLVRKLLERICVDVGLAQGGR